MSDASGTAAETYDSKFELTIVTLGAMAGTLMQALDTTIANVALPYMQGSLQSSRDQITWVLTSYVIAAAVMTAPVGWVASRFGRKNVLLISMIGFTVASMMCGMAQTLDQIVIFRLIQGVCGAALAPLTQALSIDLYPIEKRAQMMAIWGMAVLIAPILGPTLGGYLTEYYSWRWVFYVNVPFGVAASTGLWIYLKDTKRDVSLRFDWSGFFVLAMAVGAMQLVLDRGQTKGWFDSGEIIAEAVVAGLGFYLFTVHMLTSDKPFMPKELLKDRNFLSSIILIFLIGMIVLASSALLPPYLQNLSGYSVLDTGFLMAPRGFGTMAAMLIVGRYSNKVDPRVMLGIGTLFVLWASWGMAHWTPSVSAQTIVVTAVTQGFGLGLAFTPANIMAFTTLPAHLRTDASALFNLMRNIGSAVGVSVTTTVLANSMQTVHAELASHITNFNRALGQNSQSMFWNTHLPFGLQNLNNLVERNASVIAYANDFLLIFFAAVPLLLLIVVMRPPPPLVPREAVELVE